MKTEEKIKELFDKIEQLKKEVEHLQNDFEKPEKWQDSLVQPNKGDTYWYITSGGSDGFGVYSLSDPYSQRKPEQAFRTKEQAELIKEKMLLMQEMFAFAHVRNEGWVTDWNNSNQKKYGVLKRNLGIIEVDYFYHVNHFVFGIAVKSQEIAEEMLSIFGERIEKYYNKQY